MYICLFIYLKQVKLSCIIEQSRGRYMRTVQLRSSKEQKSCGLKCVYTICYICVNPILFIIYLCVLCHILLEVCQDAISLLL
jgi:hypothetical protein